jgi:hypothetical protein
MSEPREPGRETPHDLAAEGRLRLPRRRGPFGAPFRLARSLRNWNQSQPASMVRTHETLALLLWFALMEDAMRAALRGVLALLAVLVFVSSPRLTLAQPAPPPDRQQPGYIPGELVNAGHRFFGGISGAFASVIERAVS